MSTDTRPALLDLDAIEARANAATPGPWGVGNETAVASEMTQEGRGTISYRHWIADLDDFNRDESDYPNPVPPAADAAFIAAARTDVPALVAEVRRLRAEREHMELNPTGTVDWLKNRVNELTRGADASAAASDEPIPTTEEAYSWRDQLATADDMGQRLLGELHAARQAAQELLSKERLHTGAGRDGHLNEDDLRPLFDALRIELRL